MNLGVKDFNLSTDTAILAAFYRVVGFGAARAWCACGSAGSGRDGVSVGQAVQIVR